MKGKYLIVHVAIVLSLFFFCFCFQYTPAIVKEGLGVQCPEPNTWIAKQETKKEINPLKYSEPQGEEEWQSKGLHTLGTRHKNEEVWKPCSYKKPR